ncbi:kinase-like protein [Thelephora ganbajun]|uniref:Kinase-like protein n=1 Tax=Thelephora ganbajun TaxID=370292 RepID=A0ACB6ZUS5_THEGA|nr:kinase-like protein [Thelephora ganbajun]
MTLNRQLFTSTESIQRSEYEVTQMWQGAPLGLGVYVDNRVLPDRLQVLPAMPVPPPMFFPLPLFSALERVEPSSEAFLPTLDRFLASKGEHELLQQLEGSAAIHASDVLEKLLDVCIGLEYLHAQDLVHGDIKGDNVLIDSNYKARLADFGLANFDRSRWPDTTSDSTSPGGTNAYMAPELFRRYTEEDKSKGPLMRKEADIYALGMLICEMWPLVLSGEKPFRKLRNHSIALKVTDGERPRRPSSALISDDIWEMLQACWKEEPIQRPTLEFIISTCVIHAALTMWASTPRDFSNYFGDIPRRQL